MPDILLVVSLIIILGIVSYWLFSLFTYTRNFICEVNHHYHTAGSRSLVSCSCKKGYAQYRGEIIVGKRELEKSLPLQKKLDRFYVGDFSRGRQLIYYYRACDKCITSETRRYLAYHEDGWTNKDCAQYEQISEPKLT